MTERAFLERLGATIPVVAAPMAGGPTTPALVLAATAVGSVGFLAAGYLTPEDVAEQIATVGAQTDAFGVNLFAPHPVAVDPGAYAAYREALLPLAESLGVALPEQPVEDDDHWHAKVDVLAAATPRLVSFTFGLPDPASVVSLHRAGCLLAQTVTTPDEARQAAEAGLDALVVQAAAAGGHSGTFTPERTLAHTALTDLVAQVRAVTSLPVVAGGGVVGPDDVAAVLRAGADAVAVATALLLAPEAGTSRAYRTGLAHAGRGEPVLTRAFTGRPARGLPNGFMTQYDALAPLGYPALHHLTRPIRRAAAARGDPEQVNLWAGTGWREISARPAAEILTALASRG